MATTTPTDLTKIRAADSTPDDEIRAVLQTIIDSTGVTYDVTLTSAQLLALNATPISVLPAPGANKAWVVNRVTAYKPAGTAYAGIAVGEDLALKYTDAAGTAVATIETTGFLDQATAQVRSVKGLDTDVAPVANAAVVAHMLTGEIITGNTDLKLRIDARIISTVW